ncbi:MAG TPA: chemotaxis protein CheA [Fibrobacteria bacterium]|nr:chemotaxis protein CheA [Fibrobacteria bacterium]
MQLEVNPSDLDTYLGFVEEARDHLDAAEQKVLDLASGADPDAVNGLFRSLHTIKGVAGFLGLGGIQKLAHRLESVFDALRRKSLAPSEGLIRVLLDNLDLLTGMIANLAAGLEGRTRRPEGAWAVELAEVDFRESYDRLGRLLDPAPARDRDAVESGPDPETESDSEMELITSEMRQAFVKESEEFADSTEQIFLGLEAAPADATAVAEAFRNIHSFKGNCGFFGYAGIEKVAHRLETALDVYRASGEPLPKELIECALQCLDLFRAMIASVGAGTGDSIPGLDGWAARLDAFAAPEAQAAAPEADDHPKRLGEILIQTEGTPQADVEYALSLQHRPLGEILVQEGLVTPAAVEKALEVQRGGGIPPSAKPAPKEAKRDLRVDLAKLDHLMDLVGELVISTGMVLNHPVLRDSNSADLEKIAHQVRGVVTDLQAVALGVRMVPIDATFRKMTRLVHDLSGKVGKKVRLDFMGGETEVDKTVVDLIADPLVHMIRNSIDHGLETPAQRAHAGKDPTGVVTLEAGQEGGEIRIVVRDDGRGMSREKILSKAVERGLAGPGAEELPDSDVFQFIFQPGFSTAEAVTATSGRGVGMDVVKSNIDRLCGRIHIESRPGEGSVITLRIPLTLSIIDGMMVRVQDSLFILPLTAVRESIAPRPGQLKTLAGGQEILLLRGKTLPILRLRDLYRLSREPDRGGLNLLIHVEARDASFCLAVDDLLGQRQVVVKALPPFMGAVPGTSSCSILDNGEIALILDVPGLARLASRPGAAPSGPASPREDLAPADLREAA